MRFLLAVAIAASLVGQTPAFVTFTTIDQGKNSKIRDNKPREVVVRTTEEWEKLWKAHAPYRPTPSIDFSKSVVVGVFAGERGNGGHNVAIALVERNGRELVVTWYEQQLSRLELMQKEVTSPFHLVRLYQTPDAVKFRRAPTTTVIDRQTISQQ